MAGADGGSIRLSQLKGNVILLNVWATWCGPCRLELPIVQRMYDKYSDRNFVVLAVNVDADRNRIDPFMKRYNISLPIYYAVPEDAGQMTATGIPSTFIIGPTGRLLDHMVGYSAPGRGPLEADHREASEGAEEGALKRVESRAVKPSQHRRSRWPNSAGLSFPSRSC